MGIIRTRDRSEEYAVNAFSLRSSGILRGAWPSAAAVYAGAGSTQATASNAFVAWPGADAIKKGDFGILVVESSGADTTATADGWVHFPGSPVVTVADATGTKLNVLWKVAETDSDNISSVFVSDVGDHITGAILGFRDVGISIPFVTETSTIITPTTTVTWPDLTTPSPNNLVVQIASRPDDNSSSSIFSTYANGNLTGAAELREAGNASGDGGGWVVCAGSKATAGAIGASTMTSSLSTTYATFSVALEPSLRLPA